MAVGGPGGRERHGGPRLAAGHPPDERTVDGNVLADNGAGADTDEEDDPLTAVLVDPPTLGTLDGGLGGDGAFTYEAAAGGVDTFTYRVNDGFGDSGLGTVTITVEPALFADGFESGDTTAWSD